MVGYFRIEIDGKVLTDVELFKHFKENITERNVKKKVHQDDKERNFNQRLADMRYRKR